MKLEGTRKSSQDSQVDIYLISLGIKELELLLSLVVSARKYTPKTFETTSTINRLRSFQKTLEDIIKSRNEL